MFRNCIFLFANLKYPEQFSERFPYIFLFVLIVVINICGECMGRQANSISPWLTFSKRCIISVLLSTARNNRDFSLKRVILPITFAPVQLVARLLDVVDIKILFHRLFVGVCFDSIEKRGAANLSCAFYFFHVDSLLILTINISIFLLILGPTPSIKLKYFHS